MRIAYVNGGRDVPTVRFRRGFFELLQDRHHECVSFASFPSRYESWRWAGWRPSQFAKRAVRWLHLGQIMRGGFDTVVLETGLFHSADYSLEKSLRKVAKRFVYEIDDAVFLLFPEKTIQLAKMADHVIAGNTMIAQWIEAHNPSVTVIPTCVDLRQYPSKWSSVDLSDEREDVQRPSHESERIKPDTAPFVIGWVGSAGNVAMLKQCLPAIASFAREHPTELRIITAKSHHGTLQHIEPLRIRWTDIDRCDVSVELRQFDVGIMPLDITDEWSRFKCNAKMIQYMASGLPTIATDFGFNRELVRHRVNGMLATSDQDWIQNLLDLQASKKLQKSIGLAARAHVEEGFTLHSRIDDYEQALVGSA